MTHIKFLLFFLLFISFVLFSGCRTVQAPVTPFEEWTPRATIDTSNDTWLSIREQKIDSSEPLSLADVIVIALENNPGTRQAWFMAQAAEAGVKQAKSPYFPQVAVSGKAVFTKSELTKLLQTTDGYRMVETLTYMPSVDISLLLFDFGGRKATFKEAAELLIAANFEFNQSLLDLLLSVESAFYQLQSAHATLAAAEADLETALTTRDASQKKLDSGLGTKLDVLQAQSNLDQARYSLEETKGILKTAHAQLAAVLGLPADSEFSIIEVSKEVPAGITTHDISLLIDLALEQRPDIAALQANYRSKQAAVDSAKASLWPSIALGASANGSWYHYYEPDLDNDHENEYLGYIGVSWDIFDGFYNANKKRQAQAVASAAKAQLIQAQIAASADVWTKFYNYETAIKKLTFSEAYYSSAQEAYDLAIESYNSGLQNIIDVLQAQSNLSSARSNHIQSITDVFIAVAQLAHATGTLFKKEAVTAK